MAKSWAYGNRVFIEDSRDNGTFLRVTWHPEGQQLVVSHWRDEVCLAATRDDPARTPDLIALFVRGLGEVAAAGLTAASEPTEPTALGWWQRLRRRLVGRVPPRVRAALLLEEPDELRRSA
jgi:hypothetical protein